MPPIARPAIPRAVPSGPPMLGSLARKPGSRLGDLLPGIKRKKMLGQPLTPEDHLVLHHADRMKIQSEAFADELHKIAEEGKLLDKIEIREVDGEKVRDDKNVDFTMGDHHYHSEEVPENTIILDSNMSTKDRLATLIHELTERSVMKFSGMNYSRAHDISSAMEKLIRHKVEV